MCGDLHGIWDLTIGNGDPRQVSLQATWAIRHPLGSLLIVLVHVCVKLPNSSFSHLVLVCLVPCKDSQRRRKLPAASTLQKWSSTRPNGYQRWVTSQIPSLCAPSSSTKSMADIRCRGPRIHSFAHFLARPARRRSLRRV
jgi:hypothetical protein